MDSLLPVFNAWQVWLMLGVLLAIAELIGAEFILLALGVSFMLVAAVTAAFGLSFNAQLITAGLISAVLVPSFVYIYRRTLQAAAKPVVAGEGGLLGQEVVLQARDDGRLGVEAEGDFFPAQGESDETLRPGQKVKVTALKGITLIVQPVQDDS
ncbi:MAG: NfeD family protein [Gammaproteobacteria bacterium]|nr:NfeD family protein [Gammaproteobacteria bacterium]